MLAGTPIDTLEPIRPPNNYKGQRHITGLHHSPVTGRHHPFESRLEQGALIRIDFELRPQAIATQPFALLYDDGGKRRGHIPDILLERQGQRPLVIDVKPGAFVGKNARPFGALRDACAEIGWDYAIWTEPDPVYASNLSFLFGYHRPPPGLTPVTEALLTRLASGPLPLTEVVAELGLPSLTRPVLFHLLWARAIHTDLHRRLTDDSLLRLEAA
nr:TnsA-like heteromeric transposase endonuclease subunit [Deinococcus sp. HSC-46F16]